MDTSAPGAAARIAGLIVGGIGIAFSVAGWAVFTYSPGAIAARHARMEALPQPSAGSLADQKPGLEVLVDGTIAGDQPVLTRGFVAYVKEEEEEDRNDNRTWKVRERKTPPLRILLTGDDVGRVVNDNYSIAGARHSETDSFIRDSRYTGLLPREDVVVYGRIADGGIAAIEVASGTRASYLKAIADGVGTASRLGLGFMIGGFAMVVIGISLLVMAVVTRRRESGR